MEPSNVEFIDDDEIASLLKLLEAEQSRAHLLMNVVIPIGVALVYETNFDRLLERILLDAMNLCSADGGALYLRGEDDMLRPAIVRTESLAVAWGGTTGKAIPDQPIPVVDPQTGSANQKSVAARAAAAGEIVNVPDLATDSLGCTEAEAYEKQTGYRTRSCLALPLRNNSGRVIGVVELANARRDTGEISPFEPGIQQVVESLCLLASAALESYIRQQKLKDQVREMSIKIDEDKKSKQVSAIIETDYFKNLRGRARQLRSGESAADIKPAEGS